MHAEAFAAEAPTAEKPKPRTLGDTERSSMLTILTAEKGPEKELWMLRSPGDAESKGLADSIGAVFREAGWKVHSDTLSGMILKPGLILLSGDVEPPPYVQAAQAALEASGLEFKSATGYREYYEEKKKADPKWAGIPMTSKQSYVVVIGPNPTE